MFYDIVSDGMVTHVKELLGLQYVFCIMSRENNDSLNKVDVHNCRLYVKIEIETRVCAQMVMMIRLTEGLFDKSRMKRQDILEAMKSINFVLAPSTLGIRSA